MLRYPIQWTIDQQYRGKGFVAKGSWMGNRKHNGDPNEL